MDKAFSNVIIYNKGNKLEDWNNEQNHLPNVGIEGDKYKYIYGDSHAGSILHNLSLEYIDLYYDSITMFRIGRDNIIIK